MITEKTELSLKERINAGLARHWKLAVLILAAVVVIMAGILVLDYINRNKQSDSAVLAEDIQDSFTDWLQAAPESRDSTDLENLITEALEKYPGHFATQRAHFTRGLMALENELWDEASDAFLTLADDWSKSYLAPVSLYNAGAAREEAGDPAGAAEIWNRLVDEYAEVSPDAPEALFNLGRLSESSDDIEKAIEYYKELTSRFPESRWTDLAKSRILVIEGRS